MPLTIGKFDYPVCSPVARATEWSAKCKPTGRAEYRLVPAGHAIIWHRAYHRAGTLRIVPGPTGEAWEVLPAVLARIREAILRSRVLLNLADDWDESGSPRVDEDTWRRAASFLARHAQWVWNAFVKVIDAPDITAGPDGSIDLHWDFDSYEMLINIPCDGSAMAGFYGDDRGRISIKGKFDPEHINDGLLLWLLKGH